MNEHPASATKNAVIYLRVSTARQAETDLDPEGYSIPAQRAACRQTASALGAVVVEEFVDRGESARSVDRPELQRMLARVEQGDIELLIVHKLDRLARSLADDVAINLALTRAGVQLISTSEQINETPSGQLLHGIMATIAEFYSRNLSAEATKGLHQKAKMGGTPARAPLGYLNVRQLVDGREIRTVVTDPERAPHIQWAFEAFATGKYTIKTLAAELEARGLRTRLSPARSPKPVSPSTLQTILNSRYYLGYTSFRGIEYPGRHEPLISFDTFQSVQAVLRAHDNVGPRERVHNHYLKGSIFCARCHSRLCLTHSRGNGGQYFYFFCLGRHRGRGCNQPYMPADLVEQAVINHYSLISLEPARADMIRGLLGEALQRERSVAEREAERIDQRISRLEVERIKLLRAYYDADLPIHVLKAEQARINREFEDAQRTLAATQLHFDAIDKPIENALELVSDCRRAYEQAAPQTRRMFNHVFFKALYLDRGEVTGTDLNPAFAELLAHDLSERLGDDRQGLDGLSYGHGSNKDSLVGATGFEPVTSAVRTRTGASLGFPGYPFSAVQSRRAGHRWILVPVR